MRRAARPLVAAAALAVCVLAAAVPAAAQCIMCKTALTSSPEGHAMGAQFNRAILLMLVAPYVVAGAFTLVVLRQHIRAALRHALQRLPLSLLRTAAGS